MSRPALERVFLGVVVRGRGLRGEMVLDRPVARAYTPGTRVFLDGQAFRLRSLRAHQGRALLTVEDIATLDAAEALRGRPVTVSRADIALEPGEYLMQDLAGCDIFDERSGRRLGIVEDWHENGPQTLLEVDTGDRERLLIPLVPEICRAVLPTERLIRVTLPEGLSTLDAPEPQP